MTDAQRSSLISLMDAILACKHGPAEIHARATALRDRLDPIGAAFRRFGR